MVNDSHCSATAGLDFIPAELLKWVGDAMVDKLTKNAKIVWHTVKVPEFMSHLKCIKLLTPISLHNFRPIISSIGTYNYNLFKYLCELLSPNLPNEFCTKDMFTFVEELNKV